MTGPAAFSLSHLLLALAAILRPMSARCPADFDLRTGIRRDGNFACWPRPVGSLADDGTFGHPDRSVQRGPVLESRLYCGDLQPVVLDWQTVGCR